MAKYGLLGNPVAHSLSPFVHQQFAEATGEDVRYEKILVAKNGFVCAVADFVKSGGRGFNITVPFKIEAANIAHHLSENAEIANSVNTIKIENGVLYGENTDGMGFVADLTNNHSISIGEKNILIIGAGGATQGLMPAILKQKPKKITIANRTISKAISLAKRFETFGEISAAALDKIPRQNFDIIINATSAALGGQKPNVRADIFTGAVCCDLMYGEKTPFMVFAEKNHARQIIDGLGMLVEQAALSFEFWRGVKPKTQPVIAALRERAAQSSSR